MEDDFEFSCSKEHHHRRRSIKLPRHHTKDSYIEESLIKQNISSKNGKSSVYLEPTSLIHHSLNKRERWKLLYEFENNIESFNDNIEELQVSAIETRRKIVSWSYNDVKSFHSVTSDGSPVHRYAVRSYANASTLMNQTFTLKKKQWVNPNSTDQSIKVIDDPKIHVMYEIIKPCSSVGRFDNERETATRMDRRYKKLVKRQNVKCSWKPTLRSIMKDNIEDNNWHQNDDESCQNEEDWCHNETDEATLCTNQTSLVDILDIIQPQKGTDEKLSQKEPYCFQMVPMKFKYASEELDEDSLLKRFGNNYYECPTIPRRFCIDISHSVTKLIPLSHKNSSKFLIKAMCIFEVVPPTLKDFKDIKWESEDDEEFETNKVLFWINGLFANHVKNVVLHSIDLSTYHTVDSIVGESVKLVATLPSKYFVRKTSKTFKNINKSINGQTEISVKSSSSTSCFSDIGENSCGLCTEWLVDNEGLCLSDCRHWFCKSCWYQYCNEQISNCILPITCPEVECKTTVDYQTLITILPIACTVNNVM